MRESALEYEALLSLVKRKEVGNSGYVATDRRDSTLALTSTVPSSNCCSQCGL